MFNAFSGKVGIIQMKEHTKGFLIAIEGIDGSGKTTLTKIIQERLANEGKDVFALPSGGFDSNEVEAQLRKIVITENSGVTKNTETLIYFASLAQKVEQYILPAFYADKIVIVDRFILSTFVFAHYMFKQDRKLTEGILRFASQSIIPDFTFLCDLEAEVAYSRLICRGTELSRREKQGVTFMNAMRGWYLKEIANSSKCYEIIRTDKVTIEEMEEYINALEQYVY